MLLDDSQTVTNSLDETTQCMLGHAQHCMFDASMQTMHAVLAAVVLHVQCAYNQE